MKPRPAPGKAHLSYARLVKRHGKVYLVVRIKGNGHKYATLRVKPIAKHGRRLGIWTKKVPDWQDHQDPSLRQGGSGSGVLVR